MKHSLLIILLIAALFPLNAQEKDSVITERREIPNFYNLMVSGNFILELSTGEAPLLKVSGPKSVLQSIKTVVDTTATLILVQTNPISSDSAIRISLSAPLLRKIKIAGNIEMSTPRELKLDGLILDVSGASEVSLDVRAIQVNIRLNGECEVKLSGKTQHMLLTMEGASELNAGTFEVSDLTVKMSGEAEALVNVKKEMRAVVKEQAQLTYKGEPKLETEGSTKEGVKRYNP